MTDLDVEAFLLYDISYFDNYRITGETMARKLISRDDVFNAANDMQGAGKRPTILGIYKLLGRGSYTTISNYLKQWEQESPAIEIVEDLELPEVIANDAELFIGKIWSLAKNHADTSVQAERDALRMREQELSAEAQQAVDIANEHSERVEQLEELLEQAQAEAMKSAAKEEDYQRKLLVLEAESKGYLSRIQELEEKAKNHEQQILEQARALSYTEGQIDAKDKMIAELEKRLDKQIGLFQKTAPAKTIKK